jgi:hypothetical protein
VDADGRAPLSASAAGGSAGLGCWAARGVGWAVEGCSRLGFGGWFSFFLISNSYFQTKFKQQTNLEFKPRFESNNQKQCTSMYATVNSYISLIN